MTHGSKRFPRAYAQSISPDITRSLSHLWNSFKTRFGTSVLAIASASITDALVPRMDTSAVEFTGPRQFYSCAFAPNKIQFKSDTMRNERYAYFCKNLFSNKKKITLKGIDIFESNVLKCTQ